MADEKNAWLIVLFAAKERAKKNETGYAFAVQWPDGKCTVEDRKPMLRSRDFRVVECRADGGEYHA